MIWKWGWIRPSSPRNAPAFPDAISQDALEIEARRWRKGYVLGRFHPQDLSGLLRPLTNDIPSPLGALGGWARKNWRALLAGVVVVVAVMGLSLLLEWGGLFALLLIGLFLAPMVSVIYADNASRRLANRSLFRSRLLQALDFFDAVGPHLEPGQLVGIFAFLEYPHKPVKIPRLPDRRRSVWMDEKEVVVLEFPLKLGIQAKMQVSRTEIFKRTRVWGKSRWNQSSRMNLRVSLSGFHEGAQAVADSETGRQWNLRCDQGNWAMEMGRRWKCPSLWEEGPIRSAMLQALSEALQRIRVFSQEKGGWIPPVGNVANPTESEVLAGSSVGGVALAVVGASSLNDEPGGFVFDDLLEIGEFLGEAAEMEEFDMSSTEESEEFLGEGESGDLDSETFDSSESSGGDYSDDSSGSSSESESSSSDRSDS